jgi:glutamyl/glutaminyl-tRNA synthetase
MRLIRDFDEFVNEGVVKEQAPDKSRAQFLKQEAETAHNARQEVLDKIGLNNTNANLIVKESYDIIMALVRAHMLKNGFNASGHGAHEAEVAYLRVLGIKETDIEFADQLRYRRNGILYYGKQVDKEYAEKVLTFSEKLRKKLEKY